MDDAVGCLRRGAKAIQFVHVAADRFRPGAGERLGARIRAAEPDHPMTGVDEFRNEVGTDETGRTGQEHAHGMPPGP